MKPFDLYRFVISLTKEPYNTKKLPFYLARAKSALTKLKGMNWEDEDIKTIVCKVVSITSSGCYPNTYQYIIGVLNNIRISPLIKSTSEEVNKEYTDWIKQEIERIKNNAKY